MYINAHTFAVDITFHYNSSIFRFSSSDGHPDNTHIETYVSTTFYVLTVAICNTLEKQPTDIKTLSYKAVCNAFFQKKKLTYLQIRLRLISYNKVQGRLIEIV